jgi:HEAT repeat protein
MARVTIFSLATLQIMVGASFLGMPSGACLYAQTVAKTVPEKPSIKPTSKAEIDRLIAEARDNNFYSRITAAKALGERGAAAIAAIPALIDILGDERNTAKEGYNLYVNGGLATDIAAIASDSLSKLIPLANGFGFDYASSVLLAPLPDNAKNAMTSSDEAAELVKRANLAFILPSYGKQAMPVLLTVVNDYEDRDSNQDLISKIQEAAAWALGDFGESSNGTLCEILTKSPSWSVRRTAVMRLLKNKGLPYDGNEDQGQIRQKMCLDSLGN